MTKAERGGEDKAQQIRAREEFEQLIVTVRDDIQDKKDARANAGHQYEHQNQSKGDSFGEEVCGMRHLRDLAVAAALRRRLHRHVRIWPSVKRMAFAHAVGLPCAGDIVIAPPDRCRTKLLRCGERCKRQFMLLSDFSLQ
ncbi:MAG: hypothetical protein J7498_01115 [Sphingobium sp.]|nr:hypothetical protein [Sphingobium sp.]